MVPTGKAASLTLLVLAINVGLGNSAPLWGYLFGSTEEETTKPSVQPPTAADTKNRRTFDEIRGTLHHGKHKHHDSDSQEYNTYYVKIPPAHIGYEEDKRLYDHADGVDVWELPSIWDGNFVVPNMIPESKPKDHYKESFYGDSKEDDERVVKGWDNRWGFRLAIPYIGDFQYLREMGPGDFVPKLGPGRFEYPGPGEVDDPGHKQYEKYPEYIKPKPHVPVIDLTEYQGLQNYPWYTR